MARNKIEDLRNLLFEQIEKLMDDDADVDKETAKAKAISKLADTIINSAKVEIDFLKMMGNEGTGTGFITVEKKLIG
jgi:aconitase B